MRSTPWRAWPAGLFSLALSLSLACGPGGPGAGGPPQPDGGAGGGGGGGSGPTAGGSPPGGGGGGSASNPGSGGTDGGTGGASGGSGASGGDGSGGATSGGSGGSGGGGGDGGMGGGTPSAACAGLVPTFGAAVDVRFDTGTHNACLVATSSPSGQVAVGIGGSSGIQILLHSAGGQEQGRLDGTPYRTSWQDIDPWFHWTSSGYHGIVHPGRVSFPTPFESWSTSGAFVAETGSETLGSAPDANGGSIILTRTVTSSATSTTFGPTQLQWVDASGAVTRSVTLDRDAGFVLSSWGTGRVLVAVAGSGASARWFDGAGNALTPWFGLGDLGILTAHLLADGTIVLADAAGWRVALRDGVASAAAVPGWLAARPQTRLATIRHAQGYAVLPLDGNGGSFEIVTAAGESCGSFTLPPAPAVAGETRTPGQRLDVGQDGTLLELSFVSTATPTFGVHCNFRWWPALLR